LHRTKDLRLDQVFVFDDWLGGFYASPNMQGTRSGAPMAAAWAVMQFLGIDGYLRLTRTAVDAARRIRDGIADIEGIEVVGEPEAHLHAICATPGSDIDVFAVGDALAERGWVHDRQHRPDSLHATVSAGNAPVVDEYLSDLATCVEATRGSTVTDRSSRYASIDGPPT
jgi:glutamate/tyrosine decarboxylase-like PLP-dependent enzyme